MTAAPLVLDGGPIGISDVVAVARDGRAVSLSADARDRLAGQRRLILDMVERGAPVYGLTTGVGALKRVRVDAAEQGRFNRELILSHRIGHGPLAPQAVVRAAMLVRAQGLVHGRAGVRPELVEAYLAALRDDLRPSVHTIGSLGVADLGPLAEIAWALVEAGFEPEAKEGLAMLNANSFAIGWACLAIDRAQAAVHALEASAALAFEGMLANVSVLEPAVAAARPYPGLAASLARMRDLLAGGTLLAGQLARELQDPLTFRVAPQVHGGARDALAHAAGQVEVELRSGADNPLLDAEAGRAYSCGNFEIGMVAAALDYVRIALAHAATVAAERCQKLVTPAHTGLPAGLRASEDVAGDGLNIFVYGATALAVEARLLAQPASLELPTTSTAEGIEDRMSNAVLCARRLDEQAGLCERLAAMELVTAAQAVDARDRRAELGRGTSSAYALVREHVAPYRVDAPPPQDLDRLCAALPTLP